MIDPNFEAELWQTAVRLWGSVAPADYKLYVLPLCFLDCLVLRYELRRKELERTCDNPNSDYDDVIINKIKGEQLAFLHARLMKQAEASYAHWLLAA
jgi:type I restriction-modification system DNA methylase subunit